MQGYDGDKAKILARLRRVEGQVHAVAQMVEDDVYCIDVLTQISAATSAAGTRVLFLIVPVPQGMYFSPLPCG